MAVVAEQNVIHRIFMIPEVDSVLNRQVSIFKKSSQKSKSLIVKGMPEGLLPQCSYYLDNDGH